MEKPIFKKHIPPDFNHPAVQQGFIENITDDLDLLQKELSVNQSEQLLLTKRIEMMQGFVNDLPKSDPQYSMLLIQIEMDQIELAELRVRAKLLMNY